MTILCLLSTPVTTGSGIVTIPPPEIEEQGRFMTTSNSTDFNATRNDIIRGALRIILVTTAGETPGPSEMDDASEALNMMIKAWAANGIHLWTLTNATLFCTKGVANYSLPGSHCTKDYTSAKLSANAAIGVTSLSVDSIVGIVNGQNIGILLDNGEMHWTTVNGAPTGTTVIITDALPSPAAGVNQVYAYTTAIERPLRLHTLRNMNLTGGEIPFAFNAEPLARSDYLRMPNKTATGTPIQGYYDPQLNIGEFYCWPTPDTSKHRINFTYERTLEDFDNISDTPDFPQWCIACIKWNLALEIAPEYNKTPSAFVIAQAQMYKEMMLNYDRDMGSVYFEPMLS
jgi:hypothetical protein